MAKRAKKRRLGVVEQPTLDEILTPPKRSEAALKPAGVTSSVSPDATGQRAVCSNFTQWTEQEVAGFLRESGLPESVAQAVIGTALFE